MGATGRVGANFSGEEVRARPVVPSASAKSNPSTRNDSDAYWFLNNPVCSAKSSVREHAAHVIQVNLLYSFGQAREVRFVDEMQNGLKNIDACVRGAALWALGELGPKALTRDDISADSLLASVRKLAVSDSDIRVRTEASDTLSELKPKK